MSKLFLWYKNDFVSEVLKGAHNENVPKSEDGEKELLTWLLGLVGEDKKPMLEEAITNGCKIVFKDYNWDSNKF